MHENKVIENFINGDPSAASALVLEYQDRIFNLCRYMLENPQDAEDAAQDTFIKAFQSRKSYSPDATFYTWLYRIAVNTCLDHKRKFTLRSLFLSDDKEAHINNIPSLAPSPEVAYATSQSMHALQNALNRLSAKLRVVIILNELEGLSYEEIAEVLDVSVGTVKSRIFRARDELRKNMKNSTEQK